MEHLYSQQLLDRFNSGQKEFTNIHLHFCTLDNVDLSGMIIKDSKLEYTAFWHSNLKDAKFINCDMFFVSFYTALLENTIFDKCKIEMARFDSARLKSTKIINSAVSYCLIIDANMGEVDLTNTSQFKLINNVAAVTDHDIVDALRIIGGRTEDLPIEIRTEIQRRIVSSLSDFGRDTKLAQLSSSENSPYASGNQNRSNNLYAAMKDFSEGVIKYGSSEVYKSKKKDIYRK